MHKKAQETLDSVFENMDSMFTGHEEPIETKPVTIWLPVDYKNKFDTLQKSTKRKFGKKIKELVIRSIDKVDSKAV